MSPFNTRGSMGRSVSLYSVAIAWLVSLAIATGCESIATVTCASDNACPSGMRCDDGTCTALDVGSDGILGSCVTAVDCPSGMACAAGFCRAPTDDVALGDGDSSQADARDGATDGVGLDTIGPTPCFVAGQCGPGEVCLTRICQPDPCLAQAPDFCAEGETCGARCVPTRDPCLGVTCSTGESCVNGACVAGCFAEPCAGVFCADTMYCSRATGECIPTEPCAAQCPEGTACHLECIPPDPCVDVVCAANERCVGGTCLPDLCANVTCTGTQACVNGACVDTCNCEPACAPGWQCVFGRCACIADCPPDAACDTPNGCGGSCFGSCTGGETCVQRSGSSGVTCNANDPLEALGACIEACAGPNWYSCMWSACQTQYVAVSNECRSCLAVNAGQPALEDVLAICAPPGGPRAVHACTCTPDCANRGCGEPDGCGSYCRQGACPSGVCVDYGSAASCCTGNCPAGYCGPDGCAGYCSCPGGQRCAGDACCTPSCVPGTCGSDGCGGACDCPGGQRCVGSTCCTPSCAPGSCGSDGCGGTCACQGGDTCVGGACCTPNCAGKACGASDGCGGVCRNGGCSPGEICRTAGGSTACCMPSCPAGYCGSDGCGGTCGCPGGQTCSGGACCTPSCTPGTCGGDGCGGTCWCGGGQVCNGTTCCSPNCPAGTCGDDGCNGYCGCLAGQQCLGSSCCTPSCTQCGGTDGCGGTCMSGACAAGFTCRSGQCEAQACSPACGCGEVCSGGQCVPLCPGGTTLCGCNTCCGAGEACLGSTCSGT